MSDWDDDDFEVDVKQIDEKKVNVIEELPDEKPIEVVKGSKEHHHVNKKSKSKDPLKSFAGDLDRELTESEKVRMQHESDLSCARDLFGAEEEENLATIDTLPDFKNFGESLGEKLSSRVNSVYYVDLLAALLRTATSSMEASKLRTLSSHLKSLADEKSLKEKEEKKPKIGKKGSNKPTLKGVQKSSVIRVEDYDVDGYDDTYDLEDDFI